MSRWRCGGNHGSREEAFSVGVLVSYICSFVLFGRDRGVTYGPCACGIARKR